MNNGLLAGFCELEITPDKNLAMCGNLSPDKRISQGMDDPLFFHCAVLQSGNMKIAYVTMDLVGLEAEFMEDALECASSETGIPIENIVWGASHTHSGPLCFLKRGKFAYLVDADYMKEIKDKFVECVKKAASSLAQVDLAFTRTSKWDLSINRRIKTKDGKEVNQWLFGVLPDLPQAIGTAGPTDPEICVLSFSDHSGKLIAVMYNFALHPTCHFGKEYSADFPGVIDRRLKSEFGEQCASLFLQGAAGNITNFAASNSPRERTDFVGNSLADVVIHSLKQREVVEGEIEIDIAKRVIDVPVRPTDDNEKWRISEWPKEAHGARDHFSFGFNALKESGLETVSATLHTLRIGDYSIATFPGEAFVEYGLELKQKSPFPWTMPLAYANDAKGYLVTAEAWKGGGYECIPTMSCPVSVEGCEMMVENLLTMLGEMRKKQILQREFPMEITLKDGSNRVIRPLNTNDGEALASFYESIPKEDEFNYCPHPLDRINALKKTERADCHNWVCLIVETPDKEIGGYAWYDWKNNPERSEFGICMRRDHQGLGAGSKIMKAIIQTAKLYGPPVMGLYVQPETNPGAYKLYSFLGFTKESESIREKKGDLNYKMRLELR